MEKHSVQQRIQDHQGIQDRGSMTQLCARSGAGLMGMLDHLFCRSNSSSLVPTRNQAHAHTYTRAHTPTHAQACPS